MRADDPDFVYFVETRGRGGSLRASPIDVSRIVRDACSRGMRTVVLDVGHARASTGRSTTSKAGSASGARARSRVASEFDYKRQALLYLPRQMPPPKAPTFAEAAARETIELLKRSRGRAFVLFTSYAMLRTVQQFVEMALPYPILVQGTAPRSSLIEQFRSTPNAVLLATSTLLAGGRRRRRSAELRHHRQAAVRLAGRPGDRGAHRRHDRRRGGRLRRLPGAAGDPGAAAGPRAAHPAPDRPRSAGGARSPAATMGYGRRFLDSLPPAPVTHDLDAVERFFG